MISKFRFGLHLTEALRVLFMHIKVELIRLLISTLKANHTNHIKADVQGEGREPTMAEGPNIKNTDSEHGPKIG